MHDLYMAFLQCKGNWEKSVLVMSIRKRHSEESEELYEWYTKEQLENRVGTELAADLMERHTTAESKLPAAQKGRYIRKTLRG